MRRETFLWLEQRRAYAEFLQRVVRRISYFLRSKQSSLENWDKLSINYCSMQEYKTPILPRSLYFFIRCLKFWPPDSCSQADQQTAVNLVQVEAATTEAQCSLENARQAKPW